MNLNPVTYKILYNNKNITKDISDHLLSLAYTDKVTGESDEIELTLDDKDGLWQNDWWPSKGDSVEVQIIDGDAILNCGKFTVDERKLSGSKSSGDTFTISGLASSVTKKLRTKRSTAHENKTLKELAKSVADRHSLAIQGNIPDIRFDRITQHRETDLSFLNRMADAYGLLFSVRDNKLVFTSSYSLESKKAIIAVDKTEIESYEFTDKTESIYQSVTVAYHNPAKNELVTKKVEPLKANDPRRFMTISKPFLEGHTDLDPTLDVPPDYEGSVDDMTSHSKADNLQQAEAMAVSQQRKIITLVQTCSVTVPGNVLLVSGINVEFTGFGKMSGVFHITESKHDLNKSGGYSISFDAKKVNPVPVAKYKPKKKTTNVTKPKEVQVVRHGGLRFVQD